MSQAASSPPRDELEEARALEAGVGVPPAGEGDHARREVDAAVRGARLQVRHHGPVAAADVEAAAAREGRDAREPRVQGRVGRFDRQVVRHRVPGHREEPVAAARRRGGVAPPRAGHVGEELRVARPQLLHVRVEARGLRGVDVAAELVQELRRGFAERGPLRGLRLGAEAARGPGLLFGCRGDAAPRRRRLRG